MSLAGRLRALLVSGALFLVGPLLPFLVAAYEREGDRASRSASSPSLGSDPLVEVVVPAYLEASTVGVTVLGLLAALRGTGTRHRVTVVASDAETAAVAEAAGARVLVTPRNGKPAAVNAAVAQSDADVVVLTDANCRITPDDWPTIALRELGEVRLLSANKTEEHSPDALFWQFEKLVKQRAWATGTLSVVGEFLAFRRIDYRPIPPGTTSDDLWMAIDFDGRHLPVRVSGSIVTTEPCARRTDQWERRVRIADGQLSEALPRLASLVRTPAGRQYVAHKLYRLTVGPVAFWAAVCAFASLRPRLTVPLATVPVVAATMQYRGLLVEHTPADPLATVTALQAVPFAAAVRIVGRRAGGAHAPAQGWQKVAR